MSMSECWSPVEQSGCRDVARILIERHRLAEQVRVAEVHQQRRRRLPARADRDPGAVGVGKARSARRVRHRRFVERDAARSVKRSFMRVRRAERVAPRVAPSLRSHRHGRAGIAHDAQFLHRAPASPGYVGEQRELLPNRCCSDSVRGIRQLQIDLDRARGQRRAGRGGGRDDAVRDRIGAGRRCEARSCRAPCTRSTIDTTGRCASGPTASNSAPTLNPHASSSPRTRAPPASPAFAAMTAAPVAGGS